MKMPLRSRSQAPANGWRPNRSAAIKMLAMMCAVSVGMLVSNGCYSMQALSGGAGILMKRVPVATVLAGHQLSSEERQQLTLTQKIVDFAVEELELPDNGSYRTFVRLDRPHVVWNVVAARRLSLEPLSWCFPVAGCVSYRGYFKEERALEFARKLEEQGHDVVVYGVDAYSTIGRFKDPVLSTFLDRRDVDLAALLFHEIAHQQLYVTDDTTFNESFATVVEREGVRRWLATFGRSAEMTELVRGRELEVRFLEFLKETRDELQRLYGSDRNDADKLVTKQNLLDDLQDRYAREKAAWGGDARYDGWFAEPVNNARLASVADYTALVPSLERLLHQTDGDLGSFYSRAAELGRLESTERLRRLRALQPSEDVSDREVQDSDSGT